MKISYNWLKQYLKIDLPSTEIADILTDLGLEVEAIETYQSVKGGLQGVVVGEVVHCEKHPDADRLSITKVNIGATELLPIVCGAPNVAAGQKVAVATIGTTLFDGEGKPFEIKKGKIRGQESHGMICAEDELGLGASHDGIMVLDAKWAVGTPCAEVFQIENDEVFEIGLTPNRADAMSHLGVARDLRARLLLKNNNLELISPSASTFRVDKRTLKIDIAVQDDKLVPRYCGLTISGITVKPSPAWLQNRLSAIGISPKNNIVDVTNYILHAFGQPLHAFDASKIHGKIVVRKAKAKETIITLDDLERKLHEDDLVIADDKNALCIAGVLGGKDSGVNAETTTLFLESAYFNPVSIRKTAKRQALSTDASFRFERGIDPNITEYALKRAALLIKEVAGGEITSDLIDLYPKKIEDFSVFLNFEKTFRLIGQELPKEAIKNILASLDIKVNSMSDAGLGLTIPSYRVDVQREVDVIEEILRVYGYNAIQFSKKVHATMSRIGRTDEHHIQQITANQLTALGFNEMMNNSLTSPQYAALSSLLKPENQVTILNPLSQDLAAMRQSLLFSGLEAVAFNCNRKNQDLQLFEFGKTYHKLLSGYEENKHLSLFLTGQQSAEHWNRTSEEVTFFQLKGIVMTLFERLGITKLETKPLTTDVFSEGIALVYNNDVIAELGVVKKKIAKAFDIKQEVLYADLNWSAMAKAVSPKIRIVEPSKFPEVRRDLALLIPANMTFETLYQNARMAEKSLLQDITLFDVYEGDKLPEGSKSYALRFTLQDPQKTLTDVQIEKIMGKIQKQLETNCEAQLRS
ncbi:MAG: phenylalanine--tRNA ligase subunit beta [Flavobacterium sp. BFFFF2]|nr:MAG: phenylalanine--tRNA ligase subunit beta [Flavobacterium sp. BFFFF2]